MFLDTGNGSNQISRPRGSRIIGPFWAGPNCGATKMSPCEAGAASVETTTEGGSRSGREWKCWRPFEPACASGSRAGLIAPAVRAMANVNVPFFAPAMFSEVVTVTVSPRLNGRSGMKLAPLWSESASSFPVWVPVDDPLTCTGPIWPGATPRKVICVPGRLYLVPGDG